jgi:cytochrome c oxidase cbb3-type subunit III
MSKVEDRSFEYDYDGIQEYDNPLPRWWVYLFIGTIIAAVVYIPYYHFGGHFGGGLLPAAQWSEDMAQWRRLHPPVPLPDEGELIALADQPGVPERGRQVFATRCVSCHGVDGGGQVGPNLTDDYAIHGWSRETIARIVNDGVPTKGMVAWGMQLSREDVLAVALHAYALRGTTPGTAKAPQGTPIATAREKTDVHGAAGAH